MFLAFLQQAGTDLADLIGAGTFEHFVARLEAVSTRITREIFEYWSQNHHLLVEFRVDPGRLKDPPPFNSGMVFRIRIKDTRHGVTLAFDERSAGFVWFFSFIVWFSQARRTYGERLVILLDEPGLSLHARAQADLLRYIDEKLKPHYGVVYTTHSPFMIDPDNVGNARTVEEVGRRRAGGHQGRRGDALRDRDTVFPLQAALGYDAIRSLFVGKSTLLVERPGDVLYLQAFSHALRAKGRTGLDRRWAIAPTGGVDKVVGFVALGRAQRAQDRRPRRLAGGRVGRRRRAGLRHREPRTRLRRRRVRRPGRGRPRGHHRPRDVHEARQPLLQPLGDPAAARGAPGRRARARGAGGGGALRRAAARRGRVRPLPSGDLPGRARAGGLRGLSGVQSALERFEKLFADINALL